MARVGAVIVLSFAVLGWTGLRIYQSAPPVPDRVVTTDGREVIAPGQIHAGQNVWQSRGGMEIGSVWGHGSYVAPDWTPTGCTVKRRSSSTRGQADPRPPAGAGHAAMTASAATFSVQFTHEMGA